MVKNIKSFRKFFYAPKPNTAMGRDRETEERDTQRDQRQTKRERIRIEIFFGLSFSHNCILVHYIDTGN